MRWQNAISKTDLKHLRAMGHTTLSGFQRLRKLQRQLKKEFQASGGKDVEPCWTCRMIESKLIEKGIALKENFE